MILFGEDVVKRINNNTLEILEQLKCQGVFPCLYILSQSDNSDVTSFLKGILSLASKLGISVKYIEFDKNAKAQDIEERIKNINDNSDCNGILIVKPLMEDLDIYINPVKDIDGFNCKKVDDLKQVLISGNGYIPSIASAVEKMLEYYSIGINGKNICIVGGSISVGYACAELLSLLRANVNVCNEYTDNIREYTQNADIIISATGKPKLIKEDWIGVNMPVIIDLGVNQDSNGNLCGDVDFDSVSRLVSAISPVPKGIGQICTAVLLNNLVHASKNTI